MPSEKKKSRGRCFLSSPSSSSFCLLFPLTLANTGRFKPLICPERKKKEEGRRDNFYANPLASGFAGRRKSRNSKAADAALPSSRSGLLTSSSSRFYYCFNFLGCHFGSDSDFPSLSPSAKYEMQHLSSVFSYFFPSLFLRHHDSFIPGLSLSLSIQAENLFLKRSAV